MSDKQTPTTFQEWFRSLLFNLNFDARSIDLANRAWNARDAEINELKEEIKKKDELLKKCLEIFNDIDKNCGESITGQVPSGKELLKFLGILVTFPVSVPIIKLVEKIKEKKEKRGKDE